MEVYFTYKLNDVVILDIEADYTPPDRSVGLEDSLDITSVSHEGVEFDTDSIRIQEPDGKIVPLDELIHEFCTKRMH